MLARALLSAHVQTEALEVLRTVLPHTAINTAIARLLQCRSWQLRRWHRTLTRRSMWRIPLIFVWNNAVADTHRFFNQDTWSDVKIIFGNPEAQREILCHRWILSKKSGYFATLLKPDSAFRVSEARQHDQ